MRRFLLIALLLGAAPASASAVEVVASPTGSANAACTSAAPCSLARALEVAGPADEAVLLGGEYPVNASVCSPSSPGADGTPGLTIDGDHVRGRPGLARPVLKGSTTCTGTRLVNGATLEGVDVDGGTPALGLTAGTIGRRLRITGPTALTQTARLESSVASGGTIDLRASGGLLEHVTSGGLVRQLQIAGAGGASGLLRNSFALAGVEVVSAGPSPSASLTLATSYAASETKTGSGTSVAHNGAAITAPSLAGDGYHLLAGSPGIDQAVATAETLDVDQGTRGAAPDIGADELGAALPTILSAGPLVIAGTQATIRARISPNGVPTSVAYRQDGSPESAAQDAGSGVAIVTLDFPVKDLAPTTDYVGRIRANEVVSDPFAFRSGTAPMATFQQNPSAGTPVSGLPPGVSVANLVTSLDAAKARKPADVLSKALRLVKGRVALQVRCPASATTRCTFALRLLAKGGKRVVLASGAAAALPGKLATAKLKPTKAGRRAFRAKKLGVVAEAGYVDAGTATPPVAKKALTLRR